MAQLYMDTYVYVEVRLSYVWIRISTLMYGLFMYGYVFLR